MNYMKPQKPKPRFYVDVGWNSVAVFHTRQEAEQCALCVPGSVVREYAPSFEEQEEAFASYRANARLGHAPKPLHLGLSKERKALKRLSKMVQDKDLLAVFARRLELDPGDLLNRGLAKGLSHLAPSGKEEEEEEVSAYDTGVDHATLEQLSSRFAALRG